MRKSVMEFHGELSPFNQSTICKKSYGLASPGDFAFALYTGLIQGCLGRDMHASRNEEKRET